MEQSRARNRTQGARGLITADRFDAALFDLDGVLTDTARIHAACWKRLFDAYLEERAAREGEAFVPFDIDADYAQHVDGKPRLDGTRDFLASRGIQIPEGRKGDGPEHETIHGLSIRKDAYFGEVLASDGVEAYPGSVALLDQLGRAGIRTAVVSSSHNCRPVLEAAGLADRFEVRVDGVVIDELGLAGKPAPDSFLEAARRMEVAADRTVVLEDAISGVQAGRDGHFGLVVGVARKGNAEELARHGADVVVGDLEELLA
jgi:alpha,alpha-trehalase